MTKYGFRKVLILMIIIVLTLGTVVGCSPKNESGQQTTGNENLEKVKIKVTTLKGPTGMGMAELMEKNELGETDLDYEFTLLGSPDDLVGKILSGEVDVAAVPTNLALVLYNRTQGAIQLAAVNTLGVLYVVENGDSINSVEDLRGQSIYSSGKGAAPDFVFNYILNGNNLTPHKDVIIDYKLQHSELAAALVAGDVKMGLLPQPHVTTALMQNPNLRIALDITAEWNKLTGDRQLPMGSIIVQKEFAKNNKEAFNLFLDEYKQSVSFVNENNEEASELIEKFEILPKAAIAKEAIPLSNIVYIDAQDAKAYLEEFYQVLFDFDQKSIGGKLPDEGYYYKK